MKQYSIVCYLEGEAKEKIRNLQQELFQVTGSRACLDSWEPHITLGDGVEVSDEQLALLEKGLENFASEQSALGVGIQGFGGKTDRKGGIGEVTTPYVLWTDAIVSEQLSNLVKKAEQDVTTHYQKWYQMPRPYTPHITLAFRDLDQEGYEKGKKLLEEKDFIGEMNISHIALVEKLPEKDVEYKKFYLKI